MRGPDPVEARQPDAAQDLTEEELTIGGVHAKLLLGKGHFTRHEADVLLQSHDRLRAALQAVERERDTATGSAELLASHLAATAEKLSNVEARLQAAEEALREIATFHTIESKQNAGRIARAALTSIENGDGIEGGTKPAWREP